MICIYGCDNTYVDITSGIIENYLYGNQLIFPDGDKNFNFIFTDIVPLKAKKLYILQEDTSNIIDEDDKFKHIIDIDMSLFSNINIPIHYKETDNIITFIIPSLGRKSLFRTIKSIQNQTDDRWEAVVIFDHIEPSDEQKNLIMSCSKIRYIVTTT